MTDSYCCEVCARNPTCGNECGSCQGASVDDWMASLALEPDDADGRRSTHAKENEK